MTAARPLRLLLVGDDPASFGGIATHLRVLASALRPEFDIHIFVAGSPGRWESGWRRAMRRTFAPACLAVALLRWRPDVIHLNPSFDAKALLRDLAFAIVARGYGVPVLVQIHGGNTEKILHDHAFERHVSRALLSLARRVVVLTESQRAPLLIAFPALGPHIIRIPNMAPPRFDAEEGVRTGTHPYLLFMSRILRGKGIFDLLDALNLLRRDGIACTLMIAGEGPDEAAVREYVRSLDLTDAVVFTGHVREAQKAACFAGATAMVLPSFLPEGLPYAILEAMSYGVPIIATEVGGIPEIVDRTTGVLVPPRNPAALADAVQRLWNDAPLRARMGQAAMQRARGEFGVATVAARFVRLFSEIVSRDEAEQRTGRMAERP